MNIQRSWALGGLSKDLVKYRLSRDKSRKHLIERLGHLHGLPQKMAQLLALNELESKSEHEQQFTLLTEYAATLDFEQVKGLIENALQAPLHTVFSEISSAGISASLGQVHRARLLSGEEVAIKVQYPDVAAHLETDLKALGWLSMPIGGFKGFDLKAYQNELYDMLLQELDYTHEQEMLERFRRLTTDDATYVIPEPLAEYSSDRVLVMRWVQGDAFSAVLNWSEADRRVLAEKTFRFFLRSCFQWGYLHSDPHPGNYRFGHRDGKPFIGLLDFGCVKQLPPAFSRALHTLLSMLLTQEETPDALFLLFSDLGFKAELLSPMQDKLPELSRALFEPFLSGNEVHLEAWGLSGKISHILGEDRWNFRFAGPATLLFFLRTYHGLLKYLKALNTPLNWQQLFLEEVGLLDDSAIAQVVKASCVEDEVDAQGVVRADFLRIRLVKNGEVKVALKYRAALANQLGDLIPEVVLPLLENHQLSLQTLQAQVQKSELAPVILCDISEGDLALKVWLA